MRLVESISPPPTCDSSAFKQIINIAINATQILRPASIFKSFVLDFAKCNAEIIAKIHLSLCFFNAKLDSQQNQNC